MVIVLPVFASPCLITLCLARRGLSSDLRVRRGSCRQSASPQQCEWWYLGVLRYVMPLAIVLDIAGSKQCQYQYESVPGTATLEKAVDRTPHEQ
jgi:hypothetical protein